MSKPGEKLTGKTKAIFDTLDDISQRPQDNLCEFIEKIEGIDFANKFANENFKINDEGNLYHGDFQLNYKQFCRAYLMYVFLKFASTKEDSELMLFFYGFIKEFSGRDKKELYEEYWNYAHKFNIRLQRKRSDKGNLIREVEKGIREDLSVKLEKFLTHSKNSHTLRDIVFEEFCNGNLPEQISLPITEYFERYHKTFQSLVKTKSSNSQNNGNLYMDSSENNTGDTENATKPKESSGNNEIGSSTSYIDINIDINTDINTDTASSKSGSSQDEEPSHPDQPKCSMQLGTFEILLIFIPICTLCICILLLICANIQNSNRKKLAFADSISEENGRPEIKSIEFKYKDFLLHPGQSIELEVEINPPSISAKKLDYTSSNPSVAKADKNIITANSAWVEEACHETVITAQGGGIAQGKAHITVKKREDTDGMTGRGINDAISDGDRTDFQLGE